MLAVLKNISKYYEQPGSGIRTMVLEDLSLIIEENDAVAVVGPSGSGKSTLLNILGTLDQPSSGQAFLKGMDVISLNSNKLAEMRNKLIGYVFQQHYLLPQLTLLENILLPTLPGKEKHMQKNDLERALRLIDRVGLTACRDRRPTELSIGECQRGAVVRALINKPALLLADEPTGSLDAGNADELGNLLVELNREQHTALVVVTHSTGLAEKMGRKYRLVNGKLQPEEKR
ncbi:MAG: ABC transporter ATP-binding protein [Bacteroidetes bacterium]|nr:ABC transporter ATP-binding protein [Bacteroidota bacterium]